jgi:hypothetical protein
LENVSVAIFRMNVFVGEGCVGNPCIDMAVGGKYQMKALSNTERSHDKQKE